MIAAFPGTQQLVLAQGNLNDHDHLTNFQVGKDKAQSAYLLQYEEHIRCDSNFAEAWTFLSAGLAELAGDPGPQTLTGTLTDFDWPNNRSRAENCDVREVLGKEPQLSHTKSGISCFYNWRCNAFLRHACVATSSTIDVTRLNDGQE